MRKKVALLVVLALVAGLVAAGCAKVGQPASKGPTGTLSISQAVDATNLDPNMDTVLTDYNYYINIFDTLIKRNDQMQLEPCLATEWNALDPCTWEFKLRKDVKFHNGNPFTAQDVKFTIDRIQLPANQSRMLKQVDTVTEVRVVDDYTVQVVTNKPTPFLVANMAVIPIVDKETVEGQTKEWISTHPVGTGAFKFVEWVKDDHITLVANESYFGGCPKLQNVVFRPIPEDASRVAALKTGEVDLIRSLPPTQIDSLAGTGAQAKSVRSSRILYIGLNTLRDDTPLKDKRVRQALNWAVNKQEIIDYVLKGKASQLATLLPPECFGHNPAVKAYGYDPVKAKQLLTEAGYPNGFTLQFIIPHGRYMMDQTVCEAIAGQLAKVGVKLESQVFEWGEYLKQYWSKKFPIWMLGWAAMNWDGDSNLFPLLRTGGIDSYYSNPQVDQLLDSARSIVDPAERQKLYDQVQEIIIDDCPMIFLYQQIDTYGVRERVQNWAPRSDELVYLKNVSVSEK